MTRTGYARPIAEAGALRLHLNENTAGCSPRALAAVRALCAHDLGRYPDYDEAIDAASRALDVAPEFVLLTNGLDEGILAATAAAFRRRDGLIPEVIGVQPAFDMYGTMADALGGTMRRVPLDGNFQWTASSLAAHTSAATRIFFIANPHNPSGCRVAPTELLALAGRIAPVPLFVDEAYADFAGETLINTDVLLAYPNVVVGRTFSKAYGLAGLRIGVLVASPATLDPIRKIVPPYSVNAAAAAALPAALADRGQRASYVEESRRSRLLIADSCERLGFRVFASATNFMLVEIGESASAIVQALSDRGIAVRDRSREPGCDGCIRVTAGLIEDTARFVAALEDAWRDLRR
jgi:histidinol-phosphate aminotransferase